MTWWGWLLIGAGAAVLLLTVAAFALLRWLRGAGRSPVVRRLMALPLRKKLALLRRLLRDRRVPLWAKALLPALVVYLALPIDIIPDFIPVLGYADDVLGVALVVFVIVKAAPSGAIEEHLELLEKEQGGEGTERANRG